MANLIQIKRSINTAFPPGLANGELAFTSNGDILYIGAPDGTANDVLAIAGARFPGTLTANQALVANSTSGIDQIIVGDITLLGGLEANGDLGTDGQVLTTNGSVAYWADVSANGGGGGGGINSLVEDTSPQLGGTLDANNNVILLATGSNTVPSLAFSDDANTGIFFRTGGDIGFTVDGSEQFRINTGLIVSNSPILVPDGTLNNPGLSFPNDQNTGLYRDSADTIGIVAGGVEGFRVSETGGITSLSANGNLEVLGDISAVDMTLSGNLVINGILTTIDTTNLTVEDPLIALARNNSSTDTVDIGFFGLYDSTGSQDLYAGLFRDASDNKFKFFVDSQSAPTTTVNTGATGYTVATIVAHLEDSDVTITGGSISGITDLAVADGGTGVSSFTDNGIIYGNGSSALSVTSAGTEGEVLMAGASGVPEFGSIDGGTF